MVQTVLFMKRLFELILSLILIISIFPLLIIIAIVIKYDSKGPIIHWSKRVGRNNNLFEMPKFRTMQENTPQLASHLLGVNDKNITKVGSFLRKYSIDELPQLFSIIINDMSFIGPRPALFNQHDLIELRNKYNIQSLKPGITGWAQINGRDEILISQKVELEKFYLNNRSMILDIKIIFLTFFYVFRSKDISH